MAKKSDLCYTSKSILNAADRVVSKLRAASQLRCWWLSEDPAMKDLVINSFRDFLTQQNPHSKQAYTKTVWRGVFDRWRRNAHATLNRQHAVRINLFHELLRASLNKAGPMTEPKKYGEVTPQHG